VESSRAVPVVIPDIQTIGVRHAISNDKLLSMKKMTMVFFCQKSATRNYCGCGIRLGQGVTPF
jgi:hypothetical protein